MASTIPEALKRARLRAGLTQGDLAKAAGVATSQISRIERGGRPNLYFETVARLATALGVALDDLAAECGYGHRLQTARKSSISAKRASAMPQLQKIHREIRRLERLVETMMR